MDAKTRKAENVAKKYSNELSFKEKRKMLWARNRAESRKRYKECHKILKQCERY